MSKLGTFGAVAAAGLIVAGGIVALDSSNEQVPESSEESPTGASSAASLSSKIVASAEDNPYRFAVADVACLEAEGITGDDVRRVCVDYEVRGGYLGCVTAREAVHKCEVARESLPDAAFKKLMGCRCDFGEGQQEIVRLVPLGWTPPAECACLTVCDRVINSKSRANVWGDLEQCLEERCTGCDVTPTNWGPCPYCLAPGRDCAAECGGS